MFKSNEPNFTLVGTIERDTPKAVLVDFPNLDKPVWLPLSQIAVTDDGIRMNDWLVREKFGDKIYHYMVEDRAEKKRAEERRRAFEKNGRDIESVRFGAYRAVAKEFPDRFEIVVKANEHYGFDMPSNPDAELVAHGFEKRTVLDHDDQYSIYARRFGTVDEMLSALESLKAAAKPVPPMFEREGRIGYDPDELHRYSNADARF